MSRRRVLDLRFLVVLTVGALVLYLAFVGITGVQESRAKGARIDQLIHTLEAERADQARARTNASLERDKLLANQAALLRQLEQLRASQDATLAYLRDLGLPGPPASSTPSSSRTPTSTAPGRTSGPPTSSATSRPPATSTRHQAPAPTQKPGKGHGKPHKPTKPGKGHGKPSKPTKGTVQRLLDTVTKTLGGLT